MKEMNVEAWWGDKKKKKDLSEDKDDSPVKN